MAEPAGAKRSTARAPQPSSKGSTAQRLLDAAVTGFAERGYHGLSVRDLTDAIGIRAQSFYAHFPSKEALLFRIVTDGMDAHRDAIRHAVLESGPSPAEQLSALIETHVRFHLEQPLSAMVGLNEVHALTEAHQEVVYSRRQDLALTFVAVIERGIDSGDFHCADPWAALAAIGGMAMSLAWWFRGPGAAPNSGQARSGADRHLADYPVLRPWSAEQLVADYVEYGLKIVGFVAASSES